MPSIAPAPTSAPGRPQIRKHRPGSLTGRSTAPSSARRAQFWAPLLPSPPFSSGCGRSWKDTTFLGRTGVCILGASDFPNDIRSAFLEKLDSLPSLQASIADGTVSFDDYAAVLTSCTPEGHDRALFGDAFCSTRGPQETLGHAFRRFTSACQALSCIGLSFTPAWLYLALSRLLTPLEFDDFMQRPGVEPLLRSPYKESPEDHARRYGSLLDALRSFCDMAPWRDRVPVAKASGPPSGGPSAAGVKGTGPGNSGSSSGPTSGVNSSGSKPVSSVNRGGGGGPNHKGKRGSSRGGSAASLGPAPCGGPSPDPDLTSDDEPPPQAAWAAAASGAAVFYYTGNREEDARLTQDRIRRRLCLRCLPGATPPHPFGACPLHDSRTTDTVITDMVKQSYISEPVRRLPLPRLADDRYSHH